MLRVDEEYFVEVVGCQGIVLHFGVEFGPEEQSLNPFLLLQTAADCLKCLLPIAHLLLPDCQHHHEFLSVVGVAPGYQIQMLGGLGVVFKGQVGHSQHEVDVEVGLVVVESSLQNLYRLLHLVFAVVLTTQLQQLAEIFCLD